MKKYANDGKRYSDEDREYIRRHWGEVSLKRMAHKLQRKPTALIRYAENHKLGGFTVVGATFSTADVANMFGVDPSTVVNYWIKKYGLKVSKEVKYNRNIIRIRINDLMFWCKYNQDKYSTLYLEEYALGKEPEWLKEKRKRDKCSIPKRQDWTTLLEKKLIEYVIQGMSNGEIAEKMNRTKISISRKKNRLIKEGRLNVNEFAKIIS